MWAFWACQSAAQTKSIYVEFMLKCIQRRAVARSENLGGYVILGGDNVPPLVEIGLTDLTKSGGGHGPPGPPACDGPATVQQKGGVLKDVLRASLRRLAWAVVGLLRIEALSLAAHYNQNYQTLSKKSQAILSSNSTNYK